MSQKQRKTVLSLLWRVILADNVVDRFEELFAKHSRIKLGLSPE